jgi:ABC-type antimicrobial peptide transport system permease subunit
VLAILIAAAGVYGVLSYTVVQRTPEIGVRIALGAEPGQVVRMVLTTALGLLSLGLGIGLASAWMLSGWLETFLYAMKPRDPAVFATAAGVVVAAGLLAALVPSWRASRIDPVVALRNE